MRTMDEFAKRVRFELNTAVDDRLAELLIAGVPRDAIHLRHQNGKTIIIANGEADSVFETSNDGLAVVVSGRSARLRGIAS